MTLSEAVRDDLVALETSYSFLLPNSDASGRPIIFSTPQRHTREGYSAESMVSAGLCCVALFTIVLNLHRMNNIFCYSSSELFGT